jgi:3-(3-hydroxy-phenyl)propionate hydroxylase
VARRRRARRRAGRRVPGVRFVTDPRRPAVTLPLTPRLHRWELMLGRASSRLARARRVVDRPGAARDPARRRLHVPRADGVLVALGTRPARRRRRARHAAVRRAGAERGRARRRQRGWKLAAVVRDGADPSLLDTIESERRPDVAPYTRLARLMGGVVQTRRARGRPRARRGRERSALRARRRRVLRARRRTAGLAARAGLPPARARRRSRPPPAARPDADGRKALLDDALPRRLGSS